MVTGQLGGGPSRFSPDGRWWWNGRQWTSAGQASGQSARPQAPPAWRPPQRSPRFWIVVGSIAAALVLLSVCSVAVASRQGTVRVQRAAPASTPPLQTAVATPAATPLPTPSPTPAPTPTKTGAAALASTTAPPSRR